MRYQGHDGDWLLRTSDNLVLGRAALLVHRRGYSSTIQAEGFGGFSHAAQRLAHQPPRRAAQDDPSYDLARPAASGLWISLRGPGGEEHGDKKVVGCMRMFEPNEGRPIISPQKT
jgi:hypothetical protein